MTPVASPDVLIQELMHNSRASGGKPLERQLTDLTIWFYKNRDNIPRDNLAARQAFLEKAFWIMLEVIALGVERQHDLEALKKGRSKLWLPNGMKANGAHFS